MEKYQTKHQRKMDDFVNSDSFTYAMRDLVEEYIDNNHRIAHDFWNDHSFEYAPSEIVRKDFKETLINDIIYWYEEELTEKVMSRYEDDLL